MFRPISRSFLQLGRLRLILIKSGTVLVLRAHKGLVPCYELVELLPVASTHQNVQQKV